MLDRTKRATRLGVGALCLVLVVLCGAQTSWAAEFVQLFVRAKLLLKQKHYAAAARELRRATQTARGKAHFEAHYYLAVALYRQARLIQAVAVLKRARPLIKRGSERNGWSMMQARIESLFTLVKIRFASADQRLGRIRLRLKAKNAFSHPHKKRVYQHVRKQWTTAGMLPKSQLLYLPKGEYDLSLNQEFCLLYGFARGAKITKQLSLGDQAQSLSFQRQPSCQCSHGMVTKRVGDKAFCTCPKGTKWYKQQRQCLRGPPKSWIATHWPWVVVLGAGVVAGGVVGAYFLTAPPATTAPVQVNGRLFKR